MAFGSKGKLFCFVAFFLLWLFLMGRSVCGYEVKRPNVAGAFYPADPKELRSLVQKYLREAKGVESEGVPLVLIAPHAGYIYSGPVAAYGFVALAEESFETVVILAASHFFPYQGASVYKQGYFRTPLGDIEIDRELASALIQTAPKLLFFEPRYFQREHSLEVELPFLQVSLKQGFKIVPILIGSMNYQQCQELARSLAEAIGNRPILVLASTDLSHGQPYQEAIRYDQRTINFLRQFDTKELWDAVSGTGWNVCGIRPVTVGLLYARQQGAEKISILKYANSGDTAGGRDEVVGYLSALITRKDSQKDKQINTFNHGEADMLSQKEKKRLLEIARAAMEAHVKGHEVAVAEEDSPGLNLKRGVFVTLHKKGQLRGCLGQFSSQEPLYEAVSKMAIASSSRDFRFSPVEADELKEISLEISVLTEPQLIDDWQKVRLGTDGVIIRRGSSSGVFLPQVATETGWDLETFLGQLCSQKAHLGWDCYKDSQTKIYTFQAVVFSETEI